MDRPIRLGISSCLLGQAVRYDGGHKRDRFLSEELAKHVEWVPVCPELEAGLGVPRPPMRLERAGSKVRLVEIESRRDHTARMQRFAARRLHALRPLALCGYVLKQDSPSCGVARVKLHSAKGRPRRAGSGLFAAALREAWPDLPVEEEGRLQDAARRAHFLERVYAYHRLCELFRGRWTRAGVAAFHASHELQLMAHAPDARASLGRLLAQKRLSRADLRRRYTRAFGAALAKKATRGSNTRALRHASRQLKPHLDAEAREVLAASIHAYRDGALPLVVPITLLAHEARAHAVAGLQGQTFLESQPRELS